MDELQKKLLRVVVAEFAKLSETEKLGGVENRAAAKLMAKELKIAPSFVDSPDYRGSDAFLAIWRVGRELDEAGLIEADGRAGGTAWLKPTERGGMLVEQLEQDENSPVIQGKRIVKHLYDLQGDHLLVQRREGLAGGVDVGELCEELDLDIPTYKRAVGWAIRQGYADELNFDQATIEAGDVYITDDGMTAVDNEFKEKAAAGSQTISLHNSTVYGSVMAAGRDALTISHPALAPVSDDIRGVLALIQDVIEDLPEESDERHEALQELHTLTRELTKPTPIRERAERSISSLGALASITSLLMPHLDRLQEIIASLPS